MVSKRITKKITENRKWFNCWYVWKIEWKSEIVLYEWTVIEDLWEKIKCSMIDQHILADKNLFEIILPKSKVIVIR